MEYIKHIPLDAYSMGKKSLDQNSKYWGVQIPNSYACNLIIRPIFLTDVVIACVNFKANEWGFGVCLAVEINRIRGWILVLELTTLLSQESGQIPYRLHDEGWSLGNLMPLEDHPIQFFQPHIILPSAPFECWEWL